MNIGFFCPRCEEIILADFDPSESNLDIIEPCSCIRDDFFDWYIYIHRRWDDEIVILNIDKMLEDEVL